MSCVRLWRWTPCQCFTLNDMDSSAETKFALRSTAQWSLNFIFKLLQCHTKFPYFNCRVIHCPSRHMMYNHYIFRLRQAFAWHTLTQAHTRTIRYDGLSDRHDKNKQASRWLSACQRAEGLMTHLAWWKWSPCRQHNQETCLLFVIATGYAESARSVCCVLCEWQESMHSYYLYIW